MLHAKDTVRDALEDDVFASNDLSVVDAQVPDPRHGAGSRGTPTRSWRDELLLDGNSRQNLATFCQTWVEPEVHRLMDLTLDKNMIDKDEYPQTAELEARCVHILADLWNAPDAANTMGTSTTGSSEAAMLGGMALLWNWRARQQAAGQARRQAEPGDRPGPDLLAQVRALLGRRAPRDPDGGRPPDHDRRGGARKRVDENTIGVVPTLGVTFTCDYEPVEGGRRRPRRAAGGDAASTSRSTSTARAAASWPRSSIRTSSGTSGSRASSRSTPRATSSASPRWASAG